MNISHMQLLTDSLLHPKRLAAYRILSIGKVIQYAFLLILLLTCFSLGQFTTNGQANIFSYDEITDYAADLQFLVYPIAVVFLFIMNALILFTKISIYAYAGYLLTKSMKRRGEYRQLWRTTTFAITWETILTIAFTLFPLPNLFTTLMSIFITMLIVILALTKYPIQK
ncbi:MAG: DUF1189 family protein [Solibacillus sp.]